MNDKGKEKEEDAPTETRGGSEERSSVPESIYDHNELFRRMYHVKHRRSELIVQGFNREQRERGILSSSSYWKQQVPHILDVSLAYLFLCIMIYSAMVKANVGMKFTLVVCSSILLIGETPFIVMWIYLKRKFIHCVIEYILSMAVLIFFSVYQCVHHVCVSNPDASGNIFYDLFGMICCCCYCFQNWKYCQTNTFCPITCFGKSCCYCGNTIDRSFLKLASKQGDVEDVFSVGIEEDEDVVSIAMVDLGSQTVKEE